MATTKTTLRTNRDSGKKADAGQSKYVMKEVSDFHAYTTGELDAADILLTDMILPSNARISEILVYNDDLDSNGTPTLAIDLGVYAVSKFKSITSSVSTLHDADDVLDADLLIDGDTSLQAATTKFTSLALDSGTAGPDDVHKMLWELLGYDVDPRTEFGVAVTVATAAATAAAGDVVFKVRYGV